MSALMSSVIVFLTIAVALAFGVVSGWAAASAFLHLLAPRPQPQAASLSTVEVGSGD